MRESVELQERKKERKEESCYCEHNLIRTYARLESWKFSFEEQMRHDCNSIKLFNFRSSNESTNMFS
jgi:hypothetical protein